VYSQTNPDHPLVSEIVYEVTLNPEPCTVNLKPSRLSLADPSGFADFIKTGSGGFFRIKAQPLTLENPPGSVCMV